MSQGLNTKAVCDFRAARNKKRAALLRHRVLRGAVTMGGTSDMATALRVMAVLSRDGELDGYRIVTRGQR